MPSHSIYAGIPMKKPPKKLGLYPTEGLACCQGCNAIRSGSSMTAGSTWVWKTTTISHRLVILHFYIATRQTG